MTNKSRKKTVKGRVIADVLTIIVEDRFYGLVELEKKSKFCWAVILSCCNNAVRNGLLVRQDIKSDGNKDDITFALAISFPNLVGNNFIHQYDKGDYIDKTLLLAHKAFSLVSMNHRFFKVNLKYV